MNILEGLRNQYYVSNYNEDFLEVLRKSFLVYLKTSARSNEKLKVLHGFISNTLFKLIGYDYKINSLGFGDGKEASACGRYMDKKVDIIVSKEGKIVAGLAIKFVMSNYSQNSNNYFECMLGETANIRSNKIPYFQIFIIPDKIPYYDKNGNISNWEEISEHNLDKYINLSNDDVDAYMHTPNKTLVGVVHFNDCPCYVKNFQLYKNYYLKNVPNFSYSSKKIIFGNAVIYNDFDSYIKEIARFILDI